MSRLASAAAFALGLALVACVPVALGHSPDPQAVYKFSEPGEALGWSNATLGDQPSHELRENFDRDGDDRIGPDEADAMETFLADRGESGEARTAWEGQPPTDSRVLEVTLTNAEGPVAAEDPLHLHSRSELAYAADEAPASSTWTRLTESADEDRNLKIRPPPGYDVAGHEGLEDVDREGAWLEGQTSSEEDVVVVFGDEAAASANDVPAPAALVLLASLTGAAALGRRLG